MRAPATGTYAYVSEMPGNQVTAEALRMIACRYAWAVESARGREVLEVACGPGLGLGMLGSAAARLVAGDYDAEVLRVAVANHGAEVPLLRLDAQALPFKSASFDVVLMFEAVYYLRNPEHFVMEARRLLRREGCLLIALPNRDWPGFSPSPESSRYFAPSELVDMLGGCGFHATLYGTYPQTSQTVPQRILGAVRRGATRLGLVPRDWRRTEALRRLVKRLVYGDLEELPRAVRLEQATACVRTVLDPSAPDVVHRVFYVEGRLGP